MAGSTALLSALIQGTQRPVSIDGTTLTGSELLGAASAVASGLHGRTRVAVNATPSIETVVAVAGAVLAGVTVVPVPPDSGAAELQHVLRDSRPDAWLGAAPPAVAAGLPPGSTPLEHLGVDVTARASYRPVAVADDAIAFVLYTSGTTGPPKGVLMPRSAVAAGLDGLAQAWDWTGDDVLAHGLPLFHVHGLILGVLGPLRLGCGLLHTTRPTPERYAAAARAGATMFFGVPTVWSRVADSPADAAALRGARLLVSGSAALPVPVFERIERLTGLRVVERYGMSETLITVATRADGSATAGCVGVPIAGVATRLRDEHGAEVAHDGESVGQLQVRGATTFAGYLNRPDATAQAWTADGWFRTGDVATIDAAGRHRIVGRESVDLIKTGGYRVGAGEIESVLLGHAAVAECAVVGVTDADLGQRIVAYVVPREPVVDEAGLAEELVSLVGAELSAHKRPREVRFVADLPRNEMGKVQKKRLV
ncbi:acyl-CoA synthetase [Nocardioides sp. zg-536]|uniref:Acyl-CoA synthetase n=1 Tax=Nocardioides faecalis TaxID=2803858 RepID=A0A938Y5V2_9ACTN|nr:acyl-CoA synthetase [Nocardioides faecalis]MBM9459787.1 acyl-CoA synthetase [Nocardioides faecalis]QVI58299.1 acyl-CoA synthetase [Nocardioides faecalis]